MFFCLLTAPFRALLAALVGGSAACAEATATVPVVIRASTEEFSRCLKGINSAGCNNITLILPANVQARKAVHGWKLVRFLFISLFISY